MSRRSAIRNPPPRIRIRQTLTFNRGFDQLYLSLFRSTQADVPLESISPVEVFLAVPPGAPSNRLSAYHALQRSTADNFGFRLQQIIDGYWHGSFHPSLFMMGGQYSFLSSIRPDMGLNMDDYAIDQPIETVEHVGELYVCHVGWLIPYPGDDDNVRSRHRRRYPRLC